MGGTFTQRLGVFNPAVVIAVQEFNSPTTAGVVDITTTELGGLTPKAVIFVSSYHDAANGNSETAGLFMEVRALVATSSAAAFIQATDNTASTDNKRAAGGGAVSSSTGVHRVLTPSGSDASPNVLGEVDAAAVQFIPGGIRFDYAVVDASVQRRAFAVFFAGDGVEAAAGQATLVLDGTVDVNTVGFLPDVVMVLGCGSLFTTQLDHFVFQLGIALANGDQRCVNWAEQDNIGAGGARMRLENNKVLVNSAVDTGALNWSAVAGDFDASGFSLTHTSGAQSAVQVVPWLALTFNGRPVSLSGFDTPTGTGNQSYGTPGFQPQAAILIGTNLEAENTAPSGTNDLYGGLSISAASVSEQWGGQFRNDPGADPTDTACLVRTGVGSPSHAAMSACLGTLTFDSAGFDINWSAVQGTAKKWFALVVGAT